MLRKLNPLRLFKKLKALFGGTERIESQLTQLRDLTLFHQTRQLQVAHPNPLNKFGKKCFSQADEDGITIEILKRLGVVRDGIYAEFGVGDGMENNTLILAALGWKGFWVGGEAIRINIDHVDKSKFSYFREWITLENITGLVQKGLAHIQSDKIDVLSLDLDGNDIFLIEKLLSDGIRPKLFIVEYNAKFPPPVEFQIKYDARHVYRGNDYFGASLSSFDKLFRSFNFRLICCNSHTGANAFFVDGKYVEHFPDIPSDIDKIYVEPRYHLYAKYGHKKSVKTIEKILGDL